MPTRLLKESICTSEDINRLSPEEEVFFYRLIVQCDDYGYFLASPVILRGRCFPHRIDLITNDIICQWLQSFVIIGLATVFEVEGSFYLCLPSWESHQQIRAKKRRYPELTGDCRVLQANEITCNHLISDDNKCTRIRIRNPIQSNPIMSPSDLTQHFKEELGPKYPNIDWDHEIEKCWTYYEPKDKTSRKKPNWKLRIMNWLDNEVRRNNGQTPGHSTGLPGNRPRGAFSDVEK